MSTSKNGLKTLWVPGKSQNNKGKIETTKKPVSYSRSQKKNEQWTLGGTKGMENLVNCEVQLEIINGVLPSTSKGSIDAIDSIGTTNGKVNTNKNHSKKKYDADLNDRISICNIEETDSMANNNKAQIKNPENDRYEKLVTCLYYTLNLCECSIS